MAGETIQTLPILMYHSISSGAGPTCISPAIFQMQMDLIHEQGWTVVAPEDVLAWKKGLKDLPEKALAITFDDGFCDYAEAALPVMERYQFPSLMFVPTRLTGQTENWAFGNVPGRSILPWQDIRDLEGELVRFGAHSQTHADLTQLGSEALHSEVKGARADLEDKLGHAVPEFAAPYGRVNDRVLSEIEEVYEIAYGVDFAVADSNSARFNLPRLEMFYYQDENTWRQFLSGQGAMYLYLRQSLRSVKASINKLFG